MRLVVVLALVACSSGSNTTNQPGSGGKGGTQSGGTGGTAGSGGTVGSGGTAGSGGEGGSAGTAGSGEGSATGGGGATGSAGRAALPMCAAGGVTFGICFVNDTEVLPLPPPLSDTGHTVTSGPATVEAVGIGTAPAACESARWFGARGTSEWWVQARAADNRLWTIGIHGLGGMQPLRTNDTVTLDLFWRGYLTDSAPPPFGWLELSDAAAAPLLWAGSNDYMSSTGWLKFRKGADLCRQQKMTCDFIQRDVTITVNDSVATVASYETAQVGGYFVLVGEVGDAIFMAPDCTLDRRYTQHLDIFEAAAAKIP